MDHPCMQHDDEEMLWGPSDLFIISGIHANGSDFSMRTWKDNIQRSFV